MRKQTKILKYCIQQYILLLKILIETKQKYLGRIYNIEVPVTMVNTCTYNEIKQIHIYFTFTASSSNIHI